ncbi:hypothetical protein D3C78_997300 [compost metagenome]
MIGDIDRNFALLHHIPQAKGFHRAALNVRAHHVRRAESDNRHTFAFEVFRRLRSGWQRVGVRRDNRIQIRVSLQNSLSGLQRFGGVVIAKLCGHYLPLRMVFLDFGLRLFHPLVLVGHGRAGVEKCHFGSGFRHLF